MEFCLRQAARKYVRLDDLLQQFSLNEQWTKTRRRRPLETGTRRKEVECLQMGALKVKGLLRNSEKASENDLDRFESLFSRPALAANARTMLK